MEINLSEEMVQNILEVSFGRICSLQKEISHLEEETAFAAVCGLKSESRRQKIRLNDLKDQLHKAEKIHELFNGLTSDDTSNETGGNEDEI